MAVCTHTKTIARILESIAHEVMAMSEEMNGYVGLDDVDKVLDNMPNVIKELSEQFGHLSGLRENIRIGKHGYEEIQGEL